LKALGSHDELLIGLHNCTDGSRVIAEKFTHDPRVRIINATGEGVASVINQLINESRFSLIGRMDADDFCLPWRFALQRRRIQTSTCDFLFSTAIVGWKKGNLSLLVPQDPSKLESRHVTSLLRGANPLVQPTMLARKSWLEKLNGYTNVAGEDLDLWLRASIEGARIERMAIPTIIYKLSENQLSNKRWYLEGVSSSKEMRKYRGHLINKIGPYKLSLREKMHLIWPPLPQNLGRVSDFKQFLDSIVSEADHDSMDS
jgi:hypothetical protein